jgi:hypothetical protein
MSHNYCNCKHCESDSCCFLQDQNDCPVVQLTNQQDQLLRDIAAADEEVLRLKKDNRSLQNLVIGASEWNWLDDDAEKCIPSWIQDGVDACAIALKKSKGVRYED